MSLNFTPHRAGLEVALKRLGQVVAAPAGSAW